MAGPVRQRYSLATGGGLQQAASGPGTTPKYAKGGRVKGTDKFTTITHKAKHVAKGFKVQRP